MTASKFIAVLAFLFIVLSNNGVEGSHKIYPEYQSLFPVKISKTHRTGYHFQPPKHWINGIFFFSFTLTHFLLLS
ncbi:hypothetical protein JCGZ_06778 [Jatropha curcas]|uniref:Uncharacterized protein n=1 Tax=Jatropha curcas TaxID=180498 RepID=A0A067KZQ5_JATCU|nr:hypothetical protein JCGZ_06778 [Jatropha curcas]